MSRLLAKPDTLGSWVLGTVAWGVGGLVSLLPLFLVVAVLQRSLGLSEDATGLLLGLGALGAHLLLWWQVLLGMLLIGAAFDRPERAEAVAGLVWLLLLVGFQVLCLGVAFEIQADLQRQTVWYN